MKKRFRKKKNKSNYKNIDIEISNIECLEENHNYIVTFKVCKNNQFYQSQIVKYMPSFKYLAFMQNDWVKNSLLKGVIDINKKDLYLHIPKYKIKANDSVLCLGHCVSNNVLTSSL